MVGKILIPEIRSLIEARNFAGLREIFRDWPRADVAEVILDLPDDDRVIIFRVLPAALAADVFEYLDVDAQQELLRSMAHEQVAAILNEMSPDDRTALLEEMPSAAARQLIRLLTPEERRIATALLGYPEGSVGRLMTPDFVAVRENWTVKEVLDYVREHGQDSETLNFIYVVDERGKLIDDLRIRNFLLRPLDTHVDEIMDRNYVASDRERDAGGSAARFSENTIAPRWRWWIQTASSSASSRRMTCLMWLRKKRPKTSRKSVGWKLWTSPTCAFRSAKMVRKRAGWLVILFLGEMLTATAMSSLQDEIARAVVLALFLPLIISSGGNSGSQAIDLDHPCHGFGRSHFA